MARAILNLFLGLLGIIFFSAGAVLLVAFLLNRNDPLFAQVINFIQDRSGSPWVLWGGVGAFLLGIVLHILSSFGLSSAEHFQFNTDLGGVGINLAALEQFIARQARALPMVEHVRPKVTTSADGKRLRLSLETSIVATGSIKNVTEAVQAAVVSAIRDGLGLTEIETVNVDVTKISTPKGGLAVPSAALAAGEATAPPLLGKPVAASDPGPPVSESVSTEAGHADEAHHSLP